MVKINLYSVSRYLNLVEIYIHSFPVILMFQNVRDFSHLELELLFGEFSKRFHFHFYGERPTNSPAKPEWFFTQLSLWAANHVEFFDLHVQPMVDEVREDDGRLGGHSA